MKKIIFTAALALTNMTMWGQANNFPPSGNVGIGITSALSPLHIQSPTNRTIRLDLTGVGAGGSYTWQSWQTNSVEQWRVVGRDNDNANLEFWNKNSNKVLTLLQNGNIGIGTNSPNATLHVPNGTAIIGGTHSLSLAQLNNSLGVISKDNSALTYPFYVGQSSGTDIFWVKGNGNGFFKGQVGIGTITTGSHKLAVEGSIGAREIKVEASGWSDFVFEDEYELSTLEEVEQYINKNGHLPEIPSEAEVTENGINLGKMNAKLLQKIEELTLYLIEQNKEIKNLRVEVSALKIE